MILFAFKILFFLIGMVLISAGLAGFFNAEDILEPLMSADMDNNMTTMDMFIQFFWAILMLGVMGVGFILATAFMSE